ncbi:MAG: methyl-accepting chemotaxis protein [Candidatus Cohnella colombiensis]|uniref:Methyl-accepting chemotaxis protein n=1 Tax=Candidatus Cohnella colombiensis TaxID=3121368 RepID=A0AA95JAQ3_9BACL|nr:MAG: methyl-accepting chemotaxis protein [Cohnella sp.]
MTSTSVLERAATNQDDNYAESTINPSSQSSKQPSTGNATPTRSTMSPSPNNKPIKVDQWLKHCPIVDESQSCDELVVLFRKNKDVDCAVVCNELRQPIGLLMRYRFFRVVGSLYGMSLFGHRSIGEIMDSTPLTADLDMELQHLIDQSLSRDEATFYDAVILTKHGKFAGIITVDDLLHASQLLQKEAVSSQVRTVRATEVLVEHIHGSVNKLVETTTDTQVCSDRIAEIADKGRADVGEMLKLFTMWSSIALKQEAAIDELTQRNAAANGIIRLIVQLAEQCNLLAVNATIEAARAGEHGRGFAVVADEIRHLSDQTKQSASQITKQLQSMSEAVGSVTSLVHEGKLGADQGFVQVKRTEDMFAQLWSASTMNHEAATRLKQASQEASDISSDIRNEFTKLVTQLQSNR